MQLFRPLHKFYEIFKEAQLTVIKEREQFGLPASFERIFLFALQWFPKDYNSIFLIILMIKMVLLCAMLVALVVSATGRTTQNSYLKSSPGIQISFYPSLGFSNQTGSCFGESELNSLIGFLSKASTLYRSDLKENLKYIQQNMDASFGTSNERYNVFIQNNPSSISSYLVYPSGQGGCNYASLTFGINLVNPEWSYLVVKNYYSYVPEFKYVG